MQLERILHSQGFGSRKACRLLITSGAVTIQGEPCTDAHAEFSAQGLEFSVNGESWQYRDKVYLLLHKPAGYECSHKPQHHRSIFSILPGPLVARGIQCVGRLDADTTGLLLLTDDGAWLHALTSPRRHVPKTYRVTTTDPITTELLDNLRTGVLLHDETEPLAAQSCEQTASHQLLLTITQGKYHQVKRMLAAAGSHVAALHRESMDSWALGDMAEGSWRYLDAPAQLST